MLAAGSDNGKRWQADRFMSDGVVARAARFHRDKR